jgi:hypothetical protein
MVLGLGTSVWWSSIVAETIRSSEAVELALHRDRDLRLSLPRSHADEVSVRCCPAPSRARTVQPRRRPHGDDSIDSSANANSGASSRLLRLSNDFGRIPRGHEVVPALQLLRFVAEGGIGALQPL